MLGSIYLQDWLEFLVFPSERLSFTADDVLAICFANDGALPQ